MQKALSSYGLHYSEMHTKKFFFIVEIGINHNGDMELLEEMASEGRYTFISTGMSTWEEADAAVDVFRCHGCLFELLHCNSTYPMAVEDANLLLIAEIRNRYNVPTGFSSHETGDVATIGAVLVTTDPGGTNAII